MIREMSCNFAAASQGSGENMALRVKLGIFGPHQAALNQPSDIGMIARESGNRSTANMVEAAVADVRKVQFAAYYRQCSTRRSHPIKLRMLPGVTLNGLMSRFETSQQRILRTGAKGMPIKLSHRLDREAGSLLPAFVTAQVLPAVHGKWYPIR